VSFKLEFQGLSELREALLNLPAELRDDAAAIIAETAAAAEADIKAGYLARARSGDLADATEVIAIPPRNDFAAAAAVFNAKKYATWFENGTNTRQTGLGLNRGQSQPPGNVFIPRILKHRAAMFDRLAAMLRRHGLLTETQ
jgi:hypothetical protein